MTLGPRMTVVVLFLVVLGEGDGEMQDLQVVWVVWVVVRTVVRAMRVCISLV